MNLSIFQNPLKKFAMISKIPFLNKIKAITVELIVQSPRTFSNVLWNLATKTYPKLVTLRLFLKISKKNFTNVNKIEKFLMITIRLFIRLFQITQVIQIP